MELTSGTRAFVTGASRGIGRALAERLAARGAIVGLAARSADELEAVRAGLPGDHHTVHPCDVSDETVVAEAIEAFVARHGGIDLLVANAGLAHYGPFRDQSLKDALQMSEVNWHGTLFTVHAALPHLLDQARGHIVVVSSGVALRSFPWGAVYGATKAAQRGFAEALRHELSGTGVSVTTVYPGSTETSLHAQEAADRMPDWTRVGPPPVAAGEIADRIVSGVEADVRSVYHPSNIWLLGAVHNASPRLSDAILRQVRGATAAPRRD